MPIYRDKARGQWIFEFDRRVAGVRQRARQRLPPAWSRAQADAYDRKESARLYALSTGIERDRPTIERAIELYLNDKAGAKTIGETAKELARIFWAYQGKAIDQLPAVARDLTKFAAEDGWQPATLQRRIAYLRAACRWAWKQHELGDRDPGERLALPTVRNEKTNFLTRREAVRAARKIPNRAARAAFLVGFYSGMRVGEIIRARATGDVWIVRDTKNGDDAFVPVHRKVAVYSRRWPRKLARITVQQHARRALDAIGRPDASTHTLRHSTATAILASSKSLAVVGAVLRHRDPRSSKRYAHAQLGHVAAEMDRLADKSPTVPTGRGNEKAA